MTYDNTGIVTGLGAVGDGLTFDVADDGTGNLRTESAPVLDRVEGSQSRVGGLVDGSVELRRVGVGGAIPVGAPDTRVGGAGSSVTESRNRLGRNASGESDKESSSGLHDDDDGRESGKVVLVLGMNGVSLREKRKLKRLEKDRTKTSGCRRRRGKEMKVRSQGEREAAGMKRRLKETWKAAAAL